MYSIALGLLTLDFDTALIMVSNNGDYDWMNEEWRDIRQEIVILQGETSAKVIGVTGRFAEKAHIRSRSFRRTSLLKAKSLNTS